ncbi:hypothetical protein HDF25_002846 [Pedobacter cryoconitis]|uniref:Uncharacterized protein n=1 Tax=Pedobacter cryoconitis TaxID=188932 RepID=A0A7X0MIR7_9SPHI|nr:hypothetical protein [Pedobacter cryoconitis]
MRKTIFNSVYLNTKSLIILAGCSKSRYGIIDGVGYTISPVEESKNLYLEAKEFSFHTHSGRYF